MSRSVSRCIRGAVFASCGLAGVGAHAAGFAIIEHSAQGMGNAFAGGGALAEDGSTIWFNPAGMTRLPDVVQFSSHLIDASFDFEGGATSAAGAPVQGLNSVDGGKPGLVPNFYAVRHLNEDITLGIGVNAPFGLSTKYKRQWVGRYQAVESKISSINVNPAMAWKLTERLSLGAGASVQYMRARISSAIDFRSACLGVARDLGNGAAAAAGAGDLATAARLGAQAATLGGTCRGPADSALDGFGETKADGVSFGFNFGLFYELSENTRFSAAFRSSVDHNLDGDISTDLPANQVVADTFATTFPKTGATADVKLPANISLSAYHRFNQKFAVMADATWTQWSKIQDLTVVFDNPVGGRSQSVEELSWKDTWRLALGFNYYHNDKITLRTGFAYDESPVPGNTFISARLPGADRYWVSVGASYRFTDRIQADFGYSHLFVDDPSINRTSATGDRLQGTFDPDANIFSVQMSYKFD